MSTLASHQNRPARVSRWSADHANAAIVGIVMLIAIAFSLDNLLGGAHLDAGALRWDVRNELLGLASGIGLKPWLGLMLIVPLVGFAVDAHQLAKRQVLRVLGDASSTLDAAPTTCACSASR